MRNNFYQNTYTLKCNNFNTAITDGDFPASGSFIDVSNFTHCAFLIVAGTLTSALDCQVQQANAANGTPADLTGATVTVPADGDNETYLIEFEVAKLDSANAYVTLDVSGAGGADDFLTIVFLGWNARRAPVTQDTTTFPAANAVLVAG